MHHGPVGPFYSCRVMDGLWHLRRFGPQPFGPRLRAELRCLHQLCCVTVDNWSTLWHFHLERGLFCSNSVKRCATLAVVHFPFSAFMNLLSCRLLRGHPPTSPPSTGRALFLFLSFSLFLLSSLFSPWWWYPCHVVMATIGPWLLGC